MSEDSSNGNRISDQTDVYKAMLNYIGTLNNEEGCNAVGNIDTTLIYDPKTEKDIPAKINEVFIREGNKSRGRLIHLQTLNQKGDQDDLVIYAGSEYDSVSRMDIILDERTYPIRKTPEEFRQASNAGGIEKVYNKIARLYIDGTGWTPDADDFEENHDEEILELTDEDMVPEEVKFEDTGIIEMTITQELDEDSQEEYVMLRSKVTRPEADPTPIPETLPEPRSYEVVNHPEPLLEDYEQFTGDDAADSLEECIEIEDLDDGFTRAALAHSDHLQKHSTGKPYSKQAIEHAIMTNVPGYIEDLIGTQYDRLFLLENGYALDLGDKEMLKKKGKIIRDVLPEEIEELIQNIWSAQEYKKNKKQISKEDFLADFGKVIRENAAEYLAMKIFCDANQYDIIVYDYPKFDADDPEAINLDTSIDNIVRHVIPDKGRFAIHTKNKDIIIGLLDRIRHTYFCTEALLGKTPEEGLSEEKMFFDAISEKEHSIRYNGHTLIFVGATTQKAFDEHITEIRQAKQKKENPDGGQDGTPGCDDGVPEQINDEPNNMTLPYSARTILKIETSERKEKSSSPVIVEDDSWDEVDILLSKATNGESDRKAGSNNP